jgi:peptide/nickel transport system permease protein
VVVFALRRLLHTIPVLAVSSFLSFAFVSLAGDPLGQLRQNPRVSAVTLRHLRHQYHLDESIPMRYLHWLHDAFTNGLGVSLNTLQPVWPDVQRTLLHTAQLIVISESVALVLGIAIGVYSAIRPYSLGDYVFTGLSFLGFAMPTFWLALLLQMLFVNVYLHWHVRVFYTSGLNEHFGGSAWSVDRLQHLALPAITLCVISLALYSRYMRAAMLDVIHSDHVRTARAKGMPERRVIGRHVLRNALIPLVTVASLNIGALLGGAIVTETVFGLDGIGFYFVQKLGQQDVYAVMAYLLVTSLIVIVFNLFADIAYGFLDPRIRLR